MLFFCHFYRSDHETTGFSPYFCAPMKFCYCGSVILAAFFSISSIAQTGIDATYIKPRQHKIIARTFISNNAIEVYGNSKYYKPNNPLNIGVGLSVKNTLLNARMAYGVIALRDKEKFGQSKVIDIQVHRYSRRFVMDVFVQRYKGFFHHMPRERKVELSPSLSVMQLGLEGAYLFNGNKFSARAAFEQSEQQLISAGSFIVGGGAYKYKMNLGDSVPTESRMVNNLQLGFNGGYAYSCVLGTHWLLSGMATVGVNFGNEPALIKKAKINLYPTALTRMAASYRQPRWATALLVLVHNKSIYPFEYRKLNLTSVNLELSYVRHLNHFFKSK